MLSVRCSLVAALFAVALLCVSCSSSVLVNGEFHPRSPPRASMEDASMDCGTCQSVVTAVGASLNNTSDLAAILAAMEADCAKLGGLNALICDGIAGAIVKKLPKVPEKLFSAGFYTPQILCSFLGSCSVPCCTDDSPTQIHLSAGGAIGAAPGTSMTITWMTLNPVNNLFVEFGPEPTELKPSLSVITTSTYTDGGWIGSIHTTTLTGLTPGQETFYLVGSDGFQSTLESFTPQGPVLPANFTFVQVGDMGAERQYSAGNQDYINYAASSKAPEEIAIGTVLHVGDISYADGYMERWDELFNAMQPTASSMPYMTSPGNHEIYFNFTSYKDRLNMPSAASGATLEGAMYYSYDVGCIHFISLNSESPSDSPLIEPDQVAWLQADLESFEARRSSGRGNLSVECTYDAPTFAVAFIHRPLYCSAAGKEGTERCGTQATYLKSFLEPLFLQYGVDLVFSGHVHTYERTVAVANELPSSTGPIYILNGAGGNREGASNNWQDPPGAWSAVRIGEFGLGTLQLVNSTTLNWQWFQQTDLANAVEIGGIPKASDQVFISAKQQ